MARIHFWKVRREFLRLCKNGADLSFECCRQLYFRRYYDLITRKRLKRKVGVVPLGSDVAVYLIFPSAGLLDSHLFMLAELKRAGISTIVVSNLALTSIDIDKLTPQCSLIIERPNVGYDFGGYRDGFIELSNHLDKLERVWLFNDSVWLVPHSNDWFECVRSTGADFVAATSSFSIFKRSKFRVRHISPTGHRSIVWQHDPNNSNFHYASYALMITSKILKDPGFLSFWKRMEIRNDKKRTIRRGEVGLTQWVIKNSYSHAATHEISDLDQELATLSASDLDVAAREVVILEDPHMVPVKTRVLASDPNSEVGRAERLGLVLTATARRGAAYALAIHNLRRHDFPFLKKSPLWLSSEDPSFILDFLTRYEHKKGRFILEEARRIHERFNKDHSKGNNE